MSRFQFDANTALRSVVCFFISLFVLITLIPIMYYLYMRFGELPSSRLFTGYVVLVLISFSIFTGMCLRWIFDLQITQFYDCLLGYGIGTFCLLVAAFYTKGLVLILTLPTCVFATYLLFWHIHKIQPKSPPLNHQE